jgi:hypothetical protein
MDLIDGVKRYPTTDANTCSILNLRDAQSWATDRAAPTGGRRKAGEVRRPPHGQPLTVVSSPLWMGIVGGADHA